MTELEGRIIDVSDDIQYVYFEVDGDYQDEDGNELKISTKGKGSIFTLLAFGNGRMDAGLREAYGRVDRARKSQYKTGSKEPEFSERFSISVQD